VYSNFRDYKLPDPAGLLRIDAHNPPWRSLPAGFLDAILCDPPYGVRAGGRKMVPATPGTDGPEKCTPRYGHTSLITP
jgi:tRNA G10  N-methylase Trm11